MSTRRLAAVPEPSLAELEAEATRRQWERGIAAVAGSREQFYDMAPPDVQAAFERLAELKVPDDVAPKRLNQAQAVEALDAIVWTSDVVTERDVIHAANVVLRKHAAPSVQAAFDRVIDRCNQRFHQPGDVDA